MTDCTNCKKCGFSFGFDTNSFESGIVYYCFDQTIAGYDNGLLNALHVDEAIKKCRGDLYDGYSISKS